MLEDEASDATAMTTNSTPDISFSINLSSPPPRRKYAATIARSSSQNPISGGSEAVDEQAAAQETRAAKTFRVRRSSSQPSGLHDWLSVEQVSHKTDHKTINKLSFRRKSKLQAEFPLHYPKNSETLLKLIEHEDGVHLNAFNDEGDAPIHAIVRRKRKKRAELLLKLLAYGSSRVDVNMLSMSGETALHIAVMEEEEVLVKTLLTFGADVNPLNNLCQTPLDIAIAKQCPNIVTILVSVAGKTADNVLKEDYNSSHQRTLEPFDMPGDVSGSSADNLLHASDDAKQGHDEIDGECRSDEMVYSGGAWRSVTLRDLEDGKVSRSLYEKLNEYINCHLSFSESTVSTNIDEAIAITKQQRELLRYSKTGKLHATLTWPRAGSRVLCLDGGGVRGLIQMEVLRQLELNTGARVIDIFDWIVGTSTGGVLALALVYGKMSLSHVQQLYFTLRDRVFTTGRLGVGYNSEIMETILKKELGTEMCMNDVKYPRVLITAVCKKTNQPELHMFNNCFDDEFSTQPIWKVARYTSAAPLFFTECDGYVDGGVLANNPTEYALTAINHFYRGTCSKMPDNVNHLPEWQQEPIALVMSIGTGIFPVEKLGNTDAHQFLFFGKHWFKMKSGLVKTVENLITLLTQALMDSESVAEHCQSRLLTQGIPFYRFNPQLLEALPSPDASGEQLLNMMMETRYQTMGVQMEHLVEMLFAIRTIMKRKIVHMPNV